MYAKWNSVQLHRLQCFNGSQIPCMCTPPWPLKPDSDSNSVTESAQKVTVLNTAFQNSWKVLQERVFKWRIYGIDRIKIHNICCQKYDQHNTCVQSVFGGWKMSLLVHSETISSVFNIEHLLACSSPDSRHSHRRNWTPNPGRVRAKDEAYIYTKPDQVIRLLHGNNFARWYSAEIVWWWV